MDKKRKSKFDILLERGAKEYADHLTELAQRTMRENAGVEMKEEMVKNMHELVTNAFVEGEMYMFRQLLEEKTKTKKTR